MTKNVRSSSHCVIFNTTSCEFRCNPACHQLIWNDTATGDIISMIDLHNDTIRPHVTEDNKIFVEKVRMPLLLSRRTAVATCRAYTNFFVDDIGLITSCALLQRIHSFDPISSTLSVAMHACMSVCLSVCLYACMSIMFLYLTDLHPLSFSITLSLT